MAKLNQIRLKPDIADEFLGMFGGRMVVTIGKQPFTDLYYDDKYTKESLKNNNVQAKAHIYFVPNQLAADRRLDEDVVRCRAIFIDDDGETKGGLTDTQKFPIPPNLTVETSPGKFHHHWLTDTTDIEEWRQVENTLIDRFNGDPACRNPARIMRVPGYINQKPEYDGWVCKLVVNRETPYSWAEIKKHFPPSQAVVKEFTGEYQKFDVGAATADLISANDIHESRIRLAMHWANTGMPKDDALKQITALLGASRDLGLVDDKRYQERMDNMQACVYSAYDKVGKEVGAAIIDLKEEGDAYTRLPRPPGKLALIADSVMEYAQKPSWEIALFTAQAMIATYGGGLFHLDNKSTTRLWTILAETGRGKAVAKRYPGEVLRRLALSGQVNPYPFMGSETYSPSFIHGELQKHRVRLFITTEAGLSGKSTAGASYDRRKYILDLSSASIKTVTTSKQNSARTSEGKKANEELAPLYGAVGVFLAESVPAQYIEVLKQSDAFRSGSVAREEICFVDPIFESRSNRKAEGVIDQRIIDMFLLLAVTFEKTNRTNGDSPSNPDYFKAIDTTQINDKLDQYYTECETLSNQSVSNQDFVEYAMTSRLYEKVLVTVLLQAICDMAYGATKISIPVATPEMFDYAVLYQEELLRSLIAQNSSGHLADDVDVCVERLIEACVSYGSPRGSSRDRKHSVDYKTKTIRRGWFKAVLDKTKNKAVRNLIEQQHGNYDRAVQLVVRELEDRNILIPKDPKKGHWRINL